MKGLCSILVIILLALAGPKCYAQYTNKQVDSLLDSADRENNLNLAVKQAMAAYQASKTIGYQEGQVRALLIRARKYGFNKHYEDGFRYAVEADSMATALGDPYYIALLLGIKGFCYANLGFYKDAEEEYLRAIAVAQQIQDADRRHNSLGFLYSALAQKIEHSKGDLKRASFYVLKGYSEYSKIKDLEKFPHAAPVSVYNYGDDFLTLKQYDSAEFYLKKAVILSKANQDDRILGYTYSDLGELYYQKKNYRASVVNYKEAIRLITAGKISGDLKEAYVGLSKAYMALHQTENAQKYLERSVEISDSVASVEKNAIRTPLGYIVKYKERQLAASRTRSRNIIILTSSLVAVIAFVGWGYYRTTGKRLEVRRDQISELQKRIELDEDKRSPAKVEELKMVVQLAVNNDPAFLTKFNEFDKEFSKKLLRMAPSLVAGEIEFCALLRLNFEIKEIARYTKTSVRSVASKKYRIRKKLNIPADQDTNVWMANV